MALVILKGCRDIWLSGSTIMSIIAQVTRPYTIAMIYLLLSMELKNGYSKNQAVVKQKAIK